ncbi:MAG: hypothetical protein AAFQ57_11555, partial [Cyanobacteria bacterium J06626_14]
WKADPSLHFCKSSLRLSTIRNSPFTEGYLHDALLTNTQRFHVRCFMARVGSVQCHEPLSTPLFWY